MIRHPDGLILDWTEQDIQIIYGNQQLIIERDEAEWLFTSLGHALVSQDKMEDTSETTD